MTNLVYPHLPLSGGGGYQKLKIALTTKIYKLTGDNDLELVSL